MRSLVKVLLLSVALVVAFAGCRSNPVYNVQDQAVAVTSRGGASMDDVRKAILKAGAKLGWQMKEEGRGQIIGTLNLRTHMAQVEVTYSPKSYSIMYRNSDNLDYDGVNIHSNYNGWVQRLQKEINIELSMI